MNKVITPEGFRTLEEKDLNEARSLLNDDIKLLEFQEIFRQNAGSNLLNLSSELEQISPEPLICIDGSQTKPEFNGKIKTTYISAISANGLIPIPGLIHKDETQNY